MLPSDMILKHQYHVRNYQHYSELVQDLLQAEKLDELTMRNHHQRLIGTTPLPEVNYSSKGKDKVNSENNHHKNFGKSKKGKRNKHKKYKSQDQSLEKVINLSSVIAMVVLIILQRSAIYPNTWSTCIRNP
jgi:hypothetical protein